MERKSLKLSSIIFFCLLGLLVLTVIVDAHNNHHNKHHYHDKHHHCKHNKCKTITTTTTKTSTVTSSTCKPTPTLKNSKLNCPDHRKYDEKSCGHGHNRHCTKTVTCTRTKTTCVTPQPTCVPSGGECILEDPGACCSQACLSIRVENLGKCI
ncbi:hypothetical protein RhiirA5_414986 [Rhizophagus irregularis]|uniref:Uncharacterized protein n=1 Tax=Rhizophagus irregularis TaxID=588596 RepID=A0A2N0PT14_9GLOM|nr:hypothetical protein RhiirA5_414986 [Rhizophagus irregularis]